MCLYKFSVEIHRRRKMAMNPISLLWLDAEVIYLSDSWKVESQISGNVGQIKLRLKSCLLSGARDNKFKFDQTPPVAKYAEFEFARDND